MSSCAMNNQDSDEEVDLEALRLAALKSRKAKYGARVNHNNLIPIVPVPIDTQKFDQTKIKKEKLSPSPEEQSKETKANNGNKENEDDKASNYSGTTVDNDQDVLSVEDKEEEDSLERLMDQLEAEISGKVPLQSKKIISSSKKSVIDKIKKQKTVKSEGDDEVELIQVKEGKEPGAVIEIRESASPEENFKSTHSDKRKLPAQDRRSKSPFRSRSRSLYYGDRVYGRSRSPYWSRSPRRSKSPYRRSRSPFWLSRRSRSSSRKSRSPFRRYRSPNRNRSPYSRFSRSRSKSFDRRRSPWSSPRRRSKSPFYRNWSPTFRRKNFNSPSGRGRRSFTPREGSKSPRRRSRSPRRFLGNSPFRRSKSPFRRSKSPLRRNKSPLRRPQSPYIRRSKSPISKLGSPGNRPVGRSRTPNRWSTSPRRTLKSPNRLSPSRRSKSPFKKNDASRKSPRRRSSKDGRSLSFSPSPSSRRNRSPLRVVERNKLDGSEKTDKPRDYVRGEKRPRSLSRENHKNFKDRKPYRQRNYKRFSPSRGKKGSETSKRSKSPKQNQNADKRTNDGNSKTSPVSSVPIDPVLEARKKKFENLGEVDPTIDKKISLKSVKESTENVDDDEDALTINLEGNLWDESEESGDEFESRFKSSEAGKNRAGANSRGVLSFRTLREGDASSRQILINKPLIEENREDRSGRRDRIDRWQGRRSGRRSGNLSGKKERMEDVDKTKSKTAEKIESFNAGVRPERRSDRKPIVWNTSKKEDKNTKESQQRSTNQGPAKEDKNKSSDKSAKNEGCVTGAHETDDFDKLISDFEKELESDICLAPNNPVNPLGPTERIQSKEPKISVKHDSLEQSKSSAEKIVKKPAGNRIVKISEATSNKTDFDLEEGNKLVESVGKIDLDDGQQDGPEDYIEDDDFALEMSEKPKTSNNKVQEKDNQSDLRAVLSRRRNQRLTKVVTLQENVPSRLVQSAFQGLGNKKTRRQEKEIQESVEMPFDKGGRNPGLERRRVLLLQRDNPSLPTNVITVPEVKPDTTIQQRFSRANDRRKRKLRRQLDPMDDSMRLDQEDEEDGGFEVEEEKQSRRFRLKRNVTLSSQPVRNSFGSSQTKCKTNCCEQFFCDDEITFNLGVVLGSSEAEPDYLIGFPP